MYYLRSVRLYLQLFVGGFMYYLRSVRLYLQLFVGDSCIIYVRFVFISSCL